MKLAAPDDANEIYHPNSLKLACSIYQDKLYQGADDGVSYGYSVWGGWRPSYCETSGYIATTFFDLAGHSQHAELRDRAIRIARWLCDVQNPDGSFSNQAYHAERGIVFDTGQDLFGLVRAYKETGDEQFLAAANRAGSWLTDIADATGRWTRHTYLGIPHVYNTRSAWALLQLNQVSPSAEQERVARSNLDWALSQESAGFFDQCAFEAGKAPFTHMIAYAIRGLWESSSILHDEKYSAVAMRAATATMRHLQADGFIPGQIDANGAAQAGYCCLTGNTQLAIIWAKMYEKTGDEDFKHAAVSALRYVMARQDIHTGNVNIRGAIQGSYPIWGRYSPLVFPNWPAKFFIDAILLCRGWLA